MKILVNKHTYEEAVYPVSSEPSIFEKRQNGREVLRLTVEGKYSAVVKDFADGAQITLVDTDGGNGTIEYDKSEFSIAGDIVDHRDGRITVYMAKPTEGEKEKARADELEQAGTVNEQAFDTVTIDYVNKVIHMVRTGRGSSRTISYAGE